MAPLQTLKWIDSGYSPSVRNIEIEGTEPYIVGGHTASGFWINNNRMTTLDALFAAGDVAGGTPQKYVTGALAEGEIAAENIIQYLGNQKQSNEDYKTLEIQALSKKSEYENYLNSKNKTYTPHQLETAMQKIMDEYAGGIISDYIYNESRLDLAESKISELTELLSLAEINDFYDLLALYEVRERLIVSKVLISHLRARKETRWHSFQENSDYPEKNSSYECFINSVMENGVIKIIKRDLTHLEA